MTNLKLAIAGFFTILGTIAFLRIVGQEIQIQRQLLELQKGRKEEATKRAAWAVPRYTSEPVMVEAVPEDAA